MAERFACALVVRNGFANEELDFIFNYRIKYQMGRSVAAGEEEG